MDTGTLDTLTLDTSVAAHRGVGHRGVGSWTLTLDGGQTITGALAGTGKARWDGGGGTERVGVGVLVGRLGGMVADAYHGQRRPVRPKSKRQDEWRDVTSRCSRLFSGRSRMGSPLPV